MSTQLADSTFTLLSISFTWRGVIRSQTRKAHNSPHDGRKLQAWWMAGVDTVNEAVYALWERSSCRNTTALEGNSECNSCRYGLKGLRPYSCSVSVQLITYTYISPLLFKVKRELSIGEILPKPVEVIPWIAPSTLWTTGAIDINIYLSDSVFVLSCLEKREKVYNLTQRNSSLNE